MKLVGIFGDTCISGINQAPFMVGIAACGYQRPSDASARTSRTSRPASEEKNNQSQRKIREIQRNSGENQRNSEKKTPNKISQTQ